MVLHTNKDLNIKGVFSGFILAFILFHGGQLFFSNVYKYFERELIPIVYILIVILGMGLTNLFMLYQYGFLPSFRNRNLKESLKIALAGIVLIWIVIFIEVLIFFESKAYDPFIRSLLSLPSPFFYVGAVLLTVISPFLEEILVRGYFFEILRRKWNIAISFFIVILFSSIMHYSVGIGLIHVILMDAIFTFLYLNGGLVSSILGHIFANYYIIYFLNLE